mmetsp:Transcript_34409/g.81119  ORF Transcript_34409/g.81119 Transcript_34409/m.81119 type:complete len:284 (+) Transcript_34409:1502-2353(+)
MLRLGRPGRDGPRSEREQHHRDGVRLDRDPAAGGCGGLPTRGRAGRVCVSHPLRAPLHLPRRPHGPRRKVLCRGARLRRRLPHRARLRLHSRRAEGNVEPVVLPAAHRHRVVLVRVHRVARQGVAAVELDADDRVRQAAVRRALGKAAGRGRSQDPSPQPRKAREANAAEVRESRAPVLARGQEPAHAPRLLLAPRGPAPDRRCLCANLVVGPEALCLVGQQQSAAAAAPAAPDARRPGPCSDGGLADRDRRRGNGAGGDRGRARSGRADGARDGARRGSRVG